MIERCKECGDFIFEYRKHKCLPLYEIREDDSDEWEEARGIDKEDAAKNWADHDDIYSAEYRIVGGAEVIVHVRKKGEESTKKFRITGEAVPLYTADEVD